MIRFFLSSFLLFLLLSCSDDRRALERVELPAESPLLVIGGGGDGWLAGLANLGTRAADSYALLDEDSLFQYRNLALVDLAYDSLTPHRQRAVERFVLAGGRLLIQDDRPDIPYEWQWYAQVREAAAGGTVPHGLGRVYAPADAPVTEEVQAFYTAADAPTGEAVELPPAAPQWDRFQVEVLDNDIYEPMEMELLPGGQVLFLERRGKMKLYDPRSGATRVVREFEVCTEGNYEDGLHGLALDPGYGRENHYIYLYYSPAPCDSTDQVLSRWEFRGGTLVEGSETEVLRVPVQRETCCHSGGSVEFGPDGLLYLSTGDNTSSKESNGYTPIDERPGRGPFDAQKSSGNTHDLRGKILRIQPLAEGGYAIPEGNLFPADGSDGAPEIYVMGARNPFRVTVDPWTNYLYWGDVGPDVGEAGRYGPQSYDEWNQAREAGNYGWPYFVGDNFAYPDRDFATDAVGVLFDPAAPLNDSPNNTGRRELPPARPALIWYPYGPSSEFPQLGQGSRSAMAGPFYDSTRLLPIAGRALPAYYHGKWFIYEWARSWIKVVTLDSARQSVVQIEDFLPDWPVSKPIDLKIGRDGALYVLEYGNDYFMNNPDARLVRITYSRGNRPPVAIAEVSETAGGIPFRPRLSAEQSYDPDPADSLSYRWFVDGAPAGTTAVFEPTLTSPGPHLVRLEVRDPSGARSETSRELVVGNARPRVTLATNGNASFLFPDRQEISYRTLVEDEEDAAGGTLDVRQAVVNGDWIQDPELVSALRLGKRSLPAGDLRYVAGQALLAEGDCSTCHRERSANVGPSYLEVAERYDDAPATIDRLAEKVIRGGNGNWGERMMSAHPTLSREDARAMVGYILSLNNPGRMPLAGTVRPGQGEGSYVLSASYRDAGGRGDAPALTGQGLVVLRDPSLEAESAADELYRAAVPGSGQRNAFRVVSFRPGGWMKLADIDLTDLGGLRLRLHAESEGELGLYLGGPEGQLLTQTTVAAGEGYREVDLRLPPRRERGDLYLVWKGEGGVVTDDMGHHRPADLGWIDQLTFYPGKLGK
ncbi:cytochrome c [Lewinella marina]|uniref:Carbohydrate-binding protein n=1 Tax=Neolewinella marina TaxID=438751 RepID=A0A2G0CH31_9BACT|nr:PQQ-dependent sugar dehydrogenase [Neolewinella marina]NJB86258.1 cytochrome c [Neolewinella marina]PHK99268.1 carbohydrate-binding protein [Neolewinella marina]